MPASEMLGKEQRIGPNQDAGGHAGNGAASGAAPPDQPAEEHGHQLCDGGKRQQPDRGELRRAGRAVVDVGEEQDREDRDAAHQQELRAGIVRPIGRAARRLRISGMTMSFDTMMASATDSTITIAVAADRPPMKATSVNNSECARSGSASTNMSPSVRPRRKCQQASQRDRHHEQIDEHEIGGKHQGGAANFGLAAVLHHADVKLPRQQHDGEERQHRHGRKKAVAGGRWVSTAAVCGSSSARDSKASGPGNITKVTKMPTARKATSLIDRFRRDREHQAVLMLGGVDVAGAEQDREGRHQQGHEQRDIAKQRLRRGAARRDLGEDRADRRRHRFELQRDVRNHADDGDQRDGGRHRLALAVARRNEVGDRRDVLALGQPHDADDERIGEPHHQHRPDIDGEEIEAGARGQPDRAEERPRRAVDGSDSG